AQGTAGGVAKGGAVYNQAGTVSTSNDTFYNNSAKSSVGAQALGGGLFNHNGTVTIAASTFSQNTVTQGDGSTLVAAGRGIFSLADSNFTATVSILSTIVGDSLNTPVEDVTGLSSGGGI